MLYFNSDIFYTRYRAEKYKKDHGNFSDVVVKICAGPCLFGYVVMSCNDYKIWRNSK